MWVHVAITHTDLVTERNVIMGALRAAGHDATTADRDRAPTATADPDALICLISPEPVLRDDGRLLGEQDVTRAIGRGTPVLAYEVAPRRPTTTRDLLHGYALARIARLRRRLHDADVPIRATDGQDLAGLVLQDLRAGYSAQARTPLVFLELHSRVRRHGTHLVDALAISMHNVDHLYGTREIRVGREVEGTFISVEPGGAGANTMVALRRLGMSTAVAGAVGDDDDGAQLREALEDDEVATTEVLTVPTVRSGRAIMVRARHADYFNVLDSGANSSWSAAVAEQGRERQCHAAVGRSRILHLSAFSTANERELQWSLATDAPNDVLVTYKPGTMDAKLGVERLAKVLARTDVLFIAEPELDLLLSHTPGFAVDDEASAKVDLLFAWRRQNGYERAFVVVVISAMEDTTNLDPVRLHWGHHTRDSSVGPDQPSSGHRPEIVDAAGARDAVVAGVLFGLLKSRPPIDCANLAYVLATAAMAKQGCRGAMLRRPQVREAWRTVFDAEPPSWLDPYGYGNARASA